MRLWYPVGMGKTTEQSVKSEIKRRGGAVKIRTIHPDPSHPDRFVRVYIVRKAGPRGGKTVRGPMQTARGNVI